MDSLRGKYGFSDGTGDDDPWDAAWDDGDDAALSYDETPPSPVGQDERRMQVRAYNYWASLLGERSFPSVEDIEPDTLPDFAPNSVLLDFTGGMENPAIAFLGDKLALECGSDQAIQTLADVPQRSLLSRITDHYMQIIANEAPIGFEAEFSNQHGVTILYRGILLPFSTDDETIDFIYGVINWKEVADQLTTDELLLEIDQALERKPGARAADDGDRDDPLALNRPRTIVAPSITRWADGPGASDDGAGENDPDDHVVSNQGASEDEAADRELPGPSFARLDAHMGDARPETGGYAFDDAGSDFDSGFDETDSDAHTGFDPLASIRTPSADHGEPAGGLRGCLAEARALAEAAHGAEVRSRSALYRAVGRAYDLSLAAQDDAQGFADLLEQEGIAAARRAPMTPVVKLVFGAGYDKSRLAEYAAVLSHAHREQLAQGTLAELLESTPGGLKAIVSRERAARRGEASAKQTGPAGISRIHRQLEAIEAKPLADIPSEGAAFSLCLIRRDEEGAIAFLGEVANDERLLARVAKHLTG